MPTPYPQTPNRRRETWSRWRHTRRLWTSRTEEFLRLCASRSEESRGLFKWRWGQIRLHRGPRKVLGPYGRTYAPTRLFGDEPQELRRGLLGKIYSINPGVDISWIKQGGRFFVRFLTYLGSARRRFPVSINPESTTTNGLGMKTIMGR